MELKIVVPVTESNEDVAVDFFFSLHKTLSEKLGVMKSQRDGILEKREGCEININMLKKELEKYESVMANLDDELTKLNKSIEIAQCFRNQIDPEYNDVEY